MKSIGEQINEILDSIKGDTNFVASGTSSFIIPGLTIEGVGEIGFPLQKEVTEKIIAKSQAAPFGKGSATIVDTDVRKTWELNPDKIKFINAKWNDKLQEIIHKVKEELSLEEEEVNATFYKFLFYEQGGFFKPHKDSEKEKGMFGTLIINLPSEYTGGEFVIEFDNNKKIIDFSLNKFDIQYTAFYADCTHELLEVKSGYRICLVYNLIKGSSTFQIGPSSTEGHIKLLVPLFKQLMQNGNSKPLAYLLEHQYTPENFSISMLKRNDNLKASVIIDSARKSGLYVNVGLLTHYLMGDIENAGDYDYKYRGSIDPEGCEIGEVFEESTDFNHWILNDVPSIGDVSGDEIIIINQKQYESEKPLQKEAEGYMGNYGMTAEYWYHHGAILFSSNESIMQFIQQGSNHTKLDWLNYYLRKQYENIPKAKELLFSLSVNRNQGSNLGCNYSVVTPLILQLNDTEAETCIPLISQYTDFFELEAFITILSFLDIGKIKKIMDDSLQLNEPGILLKWLNVVDFAEINNLAISKKLNSLYNKVFEHLDLLFTMKYRISEDNRSLRTNIVKTIISIGDKVDIHNTIQQVFTKNLTRFFLYNILHPALLDKLINRNKTWDQLLSIAISKLEKDTKHEPIEPTDWVRPFPNISVDTDKLKMLKAFLLNAETSTMIYAKAERERAEVTHLIERNKLDISCTVIKKGSPHQLVMTKNKDSYLRNLNIFKEDMKMKDELNKLMNRQ